MIVGAGRGPLVQASINAARKAERIIKIYAIEKNANAINTLLHLQDGKWEDKDVSVVWTDMRCWEAPEKADLMVSELLGSFGDNELSPECLDGAQSFLRGKQIKKDYYWYSEIEILPCIFITSVLEDGIMIPQSYTSFIAPIMSPKLYSEVRGHRDADRHPNSHYETPFVVHMQNKYLIAPPQPLFTFEHPNKGKRAYMVWIGCFHPLLRLLKYEITDELKDNDRYAIRKFDVEQDCIFHGFAGYFECTLFANVLMSTHPSTHSPGMFSWFPIYFPVRVSYCSALLCGVQGDNLIRGPS